jgi:hypothetical protein
MANGYVCVGGVDVDYCRSVRLLTANGGHETSVDCPYEIWDIWDIDYYLSQRRPNPHTEDANVTRREKIDRVDVPNMSINRFAGWLERARIPLFRGSLFSVFDGKLKLTDMDKLYISKDDVPAYSTCFWINDKRLLGYESRGRWQYRYNNMSNRYGYTISYVGEDEPLDTIEEGSLIRLSLAHWWKPEDSDDEERCYLQLSGCLIQGKGEEEKSSLESIQAPMPVSSCPKDDEAKDTETPSEPTHVTIPVREALKGINCKLMRYGKTYENTTIPMHSLKLSKTFQGQEELALSKEVAEAMMAQFHEFLSTCIVCYDDATCKYHIAMPAADEATIKQFKDWFDCYEQELDKLLVEKARIEEKIQKLRSQILRQMEGRHLDRYATEKYCVNYNPARTIMQFDRKTFKEENEELYSSYCVPKQKDATIVIRKNRNDSESQTI